MEAKIMDFQQPLKSSNNLNNKLNPLKTKDFNSTLESVNGKINDNKKPQQNTKKIDSETTSSNDGKKINPPEKGELDNEEKVIDKKTYEVVYEGIIFLSTKELEIKNEDEVSKESKMDLENIDIVLKPEVINLSDSSENLILEENNLNKEVLLNPDSKENIINILEIDKETEKTAKPIVEQNLIINQDKSNNINVNMDSKLNTKMPIDKIDIEIEEESINNTTNLFNIGKEIKDFDFQNLNQEHSSKESTNKQEEISFKPIANEEDLDVNEKPFVFFEKVLDNPLEFDKKELINQKDLVQQIVDKVKIDFSQSKNEIRIILKPEALGEMTMNIEVVKGEIVAKIMVANERTKEMIENNLIQLKEGIKDTALEIKTFEVFVGSGSDFDKHNSNQFNLKQNNKKIKIKVDNNKIVSNYEDNSLENNIDSVGLYSENGLNLFA